MEEWCQIEYSSLTCMLNYIVFHVVKDGSITTQKIEERLPYGFGEQKKST